MIQIGIVVTVKKDVENLAQLAKVIPDSHVEARFTELSISYKQTLKGSEDERVEGEEAGGHEIGSSIFVSSNWKNWIEYIPQI